MNRPIMDFVLAFVALVVIVVLVSFTLPSDWSVQRSLFINAKPEKIFPYFNNLDNWEKWSAWNTEKDKSIKYEYSGSKDGRGSKCIWQAESLGGGSLCITDSLKNKSLRYYALIQNKTFPVDGLILLRPSDLGTLMVWKVSGNLGMNMWAKYTSFMLDSFFGLDMEKSMMKLKKIAEEKKKK